MMQNRNKCQGYERGNGMTPPREAVGSNRGLSSPGSLESCIVNTEVPGGRGLRSMGRLRMGRIETALIDQVRSGKSEKATESQDCSLVEH